MISGTQVLQSLQAELCEALGDPIRINIVETLGDGRCAVQDIAAATGLAPGRVSHHLKVLRERGLVSPTRRGIYIDYQLTDRRLLQVIDLLKLVVHGTQARRANVLAQSRPAGGSTESAL